MIVNIFMIDELIENTGFFEIYGSKICSKILNAAARVDEKLRVDHRKKHRLVKVMLERS